MAPSAVQTGDATREPGSQGLEESVDPQTSASASDISPPSPASEELLTPTDEVPEESSIILPQTGIEAGSNGAGGLNGTDGATPHSDGDANAIHDTNGAHEAAPVTDGANGTSPSSNLPPPTGPKFDPVAIIGMSCRLPGGVSDPEQFYQLCCLARSGWTPIPADRFSKAGYHHPNADKLGCYNPSGGCFLSEDVALFDAPFFKITEREAVSMDPQHRLILECTYEALENAGLPMHSLAGKDVAVYAGGSFTDYELNNLRDLDTQPMHQSTGNAPSLLANRVSYFFDFRGPSHTVETACSSSLTALHLAMEALQRRDASVVVLASSHLNLLPDHFVSMSSQGLLSGDGRSYAFDSRANGFGRGEGAGVVILKPLADAQRDGDNVRAVVLGSGVNQDGRTKGITMPSGEAQLALMRKVYADGGLDPAECGYVEAHGTGTKVGDPIEMRALHDMFSEGRTPRQPLYVGSVKTNVGHLEGASGIVSMIKSAMMLERGYVLPNHDFREGNKEIPFDEWGVRVPTKVLPWPRGKKYISINSFGFGGGNAHAVLAAPPRAKPVAVTASASAPPAAGNPEPAVAAAATTTSTQWTSAATNNVEPRRLFVVSANSKEALAAQMQNITVYLERRPVAFQGSLLSNLAYTLGQRRSFLPYKFAVSAADGAALTAGFSSTAPTNPIRSARAPRVGFVFTGQGAQWHAMGRELGAAYPVFADSLRRFDECLSRLGARFSLLEELGRDAKTSRLSDAELSQPGCTAVQLALVDLLADWGVSPDAVVGHSSGEIGAAYAAGALTLEECAAAAYFRGQSVLQLKAAHPGLEGGMLAVGAGAEDVSPLIKTLPAELGQVVVACVNSPGSITASGDVAAVEALAACVEEKQLFNRRVRVDTAYHSHHMELVADWYGESVGPLSPAVRKESKTEFYSSLRGALLDSAAELDTSYWVQNLTQPVLFSQAVTDMCTTHPGRDNIDVLVEIGPHSALEGPLKQILKAINAPKKPVYLPSLVRNKDAVETALSLASSLFVHGAPLDFRRINFPVPPPRPLKVLADVPRYAWDHKTRYWWESRISRAHLHRRFARNDVLGVLADWSNALEPTWRNIIRPDDTPWVRGHVMQDMVVYPMAGYLSMAVEGALQKHQMASSGKAPSGDTGGVGGGGAKHKFVFRDVTISRPLVVQEGADTETNLVMRPFADGPRESSAVWDEFRVYSWTREREWVEHCRGLIRVETVAPEAKPNGVHDGTADDTTDLAARKARIAQSCRSGGGGGSVDREALYAELEAVSARYSAQFRSMENCEGSDVACVADIVVPDTARTMPKAHEPPLVIHPAFLDQFTHAAWVILGAGRGRLPALFMPRFLKGLTISSQVCRGPGDRLRVYGEGNPNFEKPGSTKISMFATTMDGADEVISIEGLVVDPILEGDGPGAGQVVARELCYRVTWEPVAPAVSGEVPLANGDAALEEPVSPTVEEPERVISDSVAIIGTPQQPSLTSALEAELLRRHASSAATVSHGSLKVDSAYAGKVCVVLSELDKPLLSTLDADAFALVKQLVLSARGILWVVWGAHTDATDPRLGMVLGLARTVRSETGLRFATLDMDGNKSHTAAETADLIADVATRVFGKTAVQTDDDRDGDPDMEFQERDGVLSVCRVVADDALDGFVTQHTNPSVAPFPQPFSHPGRPLKLVAGTKGALDTLHFVDDDSPSTTPLRPDEILIEVKVTSMNFKDIMVAMGEVPSPYLGVEAAGFVAAVGGEVTDFKTGDRVCASCEGAYSTYTRCKASSAAKVPDSMTLEDAATVPVVFATAYYSLFDVGRLQRGETVLVHAAAGGVGQAAVQLARMAGAEVFATVGSAAKKNFLSSVYGVPESHIFYSRDTSFSKALTRATGGKGVDVVLNSLAGDALRETWECLAPFGRFVEIGKRSILADSSLGMAVFERNASFASVDLTAVAADRPHVMRRLLDDVFRLLGYGVVRPVSPTTTFPISEVETAFRTLQAGKAHGKILVTASADDVVKATYSPKMFDKLLRADASYIVVGGTGGIGRSIVRWMVQKGARNVVVVSRSDKITPQVGELIHDCEDVGARIVQCRCDVSDRRDVDRMLDEIATAQLPPIRGLVHSAMVLDDVLFEKMEFPQWERVVKSKVAGSWNLHEALLTAPLDFFVALSSVAGIIGNQGQAAYAAANTFLDSLVQHRLSRGLPATALDLAAVSDAGYLAESDADRRRQVLEQIGGEAISEREILALLAAAITGRAAESCAGQVVTGLNLSSHVSSSSGLPFWATDARFAPIRARALAAHSADGGAGPATATVSPGAALKRAGSYADAHRIVTDALLDKAAGVLMLPREELDPSKGTVFYGLDSLVSIEIRNWITREFGAALQILDLLSSGSFTSLADTVLKKTELVSFEKVAAAAAAAVAPLS